MSELLNKIIEFADEYDMLPEAGLVLVCVSGGADSMCLLEALIDISRGRGFDAGVAHYNHGLRGEESVRDEAFVREYCRSRDIPFYSGSGDVKAYAKKSGCGLEEAARNMRYSFFDDIKEKTGAGRIATAHTADDNAETVIMNLARGAGVNGLSGIPPNRCGIVRPMLRVSRDDVMLFVSERGIPFVEDSTNSLDVFTRNKIRHIVMPVIKGINPRFNEAAAVAAELSRADEEYLSGLADAFIAGHCVWAPMGDRGDPGFGIRDSGLARDHAPGCFSADVEDILGLPFAVSGRVIRKVYGGNLSYKHVKAVLELCAREDPSARLSLPRMTVCREYNRVVFGETNTGGRFACTVCDEREQLPCVCTIPGLGLKISCKSVICNDTINKSFTSFMFKSADLCGKMTVRSRREGDTIRLYSQGCTKTLKKLFIERRIPVRKRNNIPVIADEEGVLAIYGIGIGDRAIPEQGDFAFQVNFEEV